MRLITRSDFDGLACAALLEEQGVIDAYLFVHPKDMQDGKIPVSDNDVLANVPFVPGCGLWFDHHSSEEERLARNERFEFQGASYRAPSCARVVYDYYGGAPVFWKFDENGLMEAVDRSDSGSLTEEEINQQILYELTRRDLPKKGLETVQARLTPGKVEVVCRLNGDSFYNSLSPEQRESFPGLLRTRGTLNVWLVPTVDILNRPWVQIEALQMSGIPVPVSLVLPMLKKNLKGVEYDPDYGFRLPERIRRLEVAEKAVDVDLKS